MGANIKRNPRAKKQGSDSAGIPLSSLSRKREEEKKKKKTKKKKRKKRPAAERGAVDYQKRPMAVSKRTTFWGEKVLIKREEKSICRRPIEEGGEKKAEYFIRKERRDCPNCWKP